MLLFDDICRLWRVENSKRFLAGAALLVTAKGGRKGIPACEVSIEIRVFKIDIKLVLELWKT